MTTVQRPHDEDITTVHSHDAPELQKATEISPADLERRRVVEKSLKRKLDARCSLFVIIYIMNYLDRNNIGAARLKGLQRDLNLSDTDYATCLSILYVGYILMQVPSNMLVNRLSRPSIYIGCAMLLWGMISTLSGVVTSFGGMVAVRFCLGFVEAAFLPAALLILSKWYTRRELTLRNAILFAGNLLSNAFSSLVAAGVLSNMEGVRGHAAWRWLFFIEGAATMFFALLAMFLLPDLPTNSRWFTPEELQVAQLRLVEDVGEADEDSKLQSATAGLVMALKDVKIYVMMLTLTAYVVGLSFNAFFPTLTGTLGFAYVPTLLMSAPPWVFSVIVSMINAWHADRTQEKFWHIVVPMFFGLIGFVICMATSNTAGRYIALFLQAGSYAGFIVFVPSLSLSSTPSRKGNIAGSYVWGLKSDGYRKSYGIVTAMFGVAIAGSFIFRQILVRANKKLDADEGVVGGNAAGAWKTPADVVEKGRRVEHLESGEKVLDMKRGFRYLV